MLSRRWLVNGLLVLLIAALAAIGYRLEQAPESQPAQARFDSTAVERIEIRAADLRLALHRQQAGWALVEPLQWPADRARVERLFTIVDTGDARRLQGADIDLDRLGLKDPLASLQLGQTAIRFGTVNNIGERRYTLIDSGLYLLPDVHFPLIRQGSAGFIDRRLLPPAFEVTALSLPEIELQLDAEGTWRAADRDNLAVDALAGLVENWQRLEATRIGAYENPRKPSARVVAQLRDGRQIELLLLATDPEIVIANASLGMQYHLRGGYYDRLFTPPTDENPA